MSDEMTGKTEKPRMSQGDGPPPPPPPMSPRVAVRETDLMPAPSLFDWIFRRSYIRKRWPGVLD